jgi:hypothetical protein
MTSGDIGSIRAVLFDLSGTLHDERYILHGLAHLAAALHERWTSIRQRLVAA